MKGDLEQAFVCPSDLRVRPHHPEGKEEEGKWPLVGGPLSFTSNQAPSEGELEREEGKMAFFPSLSPFLQAWSASFWDRVSKYLISASVKILRPRFDQIDMHRLCEVVLRSMVPPT